MSTPGATKSVRWRLFALITFCVAAPIVFLVTYFPATQIAALERALTNKSRSFSSMLVSQTRSAIAFDDVETAREAFDAVTVDSDVAMVALHRANGSVLAASNAEDHPAPAWTDEPVITHLGDRVEVVAPVIAAEGPRGLLVLELSTDRVSAEGAGIQLTAVLVGLLAIFVGGCAAWFVGRSFGDRTDALHASREQFRTLLETTDAVPWEMTAPDWRFTYVGPQAPARFCIPKDHWGTPELWQSHVVPEDLARLIAAFSRASTDHAEQEVEFRIRRAEGRDLWVRSLISGGDATSSLRGFMFDVTKQAELEIELRQAQKLESVGRLAAGVAHEINTPVQFVSDSVHFARDSFADLLELVRRNGELRAMLPAGEASDVIAEMEQAEQDADLEYLSENLPKALDRAIEGLSRVATIVRSMKEFAHPDARGKASADLNSALTSTLVIARAEYKDVAEVVTELGDMPPVYCQIGELNQAFLNIIVNAAHAIADVAAEQPGHLGVIRVATRCEGADAIVSISDTGAGIPDVVASRIFDPFFTTKAVGRGSGQGLAIARRSVVDGHGGTLTYRTQAGEGTTFVIRIPLGRGAVPAEPLPLAATP